MNIITTKQRKYLRKLANPLKATVLLGKQGLTPELIQKVAQELEAHELIKVRLLDYKDQKHALAQMIAEQAQADLVGVIGNVLMLYREQADPALRQIVLPANDE